MAILPFLAMNEAQAARLREETAGDQNRLEPRLVDAGPHRGKYVIPERALMDPAYEDRRDALRMLTSVMMDTDLAWPPEPEPEIEE